MARAVAGDREGDDEDDIGPLPAPVRVVPAGTWRPKALAAALREGTGPSAKEAEEIIALMLGFGSWRELARAGPNRAKEQAGPAGRGLRRRGGRAPPRLPSAHARVVQRHGASGRRPRRRSPEAIGQVGLDPGTLARMQTASDAYADERDDLDDLAELDDLDAADELVDALGSFMAAAGIDPEDSPQDLLERLRHLQMIQLEVWLGIMDEHLGWRFTDVGAHGEQDGGQVAVALGSGHRRLPVFMSAAAHVPGEGDGEQVASLKARIAAEHPAGAVLIFNQPVGWLPKHRRGGLVYGGLLWSDNAWSDFVLRPRGGLDDALAQRGRDIARPDADTVKALGFNDARGLLSSLAAYVAGLEPEDANVEFLQTSSGWSMPLVTPL